jgi:quinol monooxygenase YgiN
MWTQIIKTRLKPGMDDRIPELLEQIRAAEQPGSGLLRTTVMRDQADPAQLYMMVTFESEERAREREQDPRREEGLAEARAIMAEIFEGPREFIDLAVIDETTW